MADISTITLPNGQTYSFKDAEARSGGSIEALTDAEIEEAVDEAFTYTISYYDELTSQYATASPLIASKGATITLTCTSNADVNTGNSTKIFNYVRAKESITNTEIVRLTNVGTTTFSMPSTDVIVEAVFAVSGGSND